jgi:hypothetical protein
MAEVNLDIAKAVLTDSIPIRTIAYVTLLLLPPSLIATIFGINFFTFDDQTGSLIVAKTFWQYWAVTIPVTAFTIIIWKIWVWLEKRDSREPGIQAGLEKGEALRSSAPPQAMVDSATLKM